MSEITLTHAVRQNLLSLQNTSMLMARTQDRLATGNKINSALDNPNSFFTAASLNDRSTDLSKLLDSMGQAVQTLKAADDGLMAITKLAEAAKAKANQAQQTTVLSERAGLAAEYNALLAQIEGLAQDAGYNGKNLLTGSGNDVTVIFNEYNTNTLVIEAVDYTDTTLIGGINIAAIGPTTAIAGVTATASLTSSGTLAGAGIVESNVDGANGLAGLEDGDVLTITNGVATETLAITATTDYNDIVTKFAAFGAVINGNSIDFTSTVGDLTISATDADGDSTQLTTVASSNFVQGIDAGGLFETDQSIQTAIEQINTSLRVLRAQASKFGTNLTVVNNRERFTREMMITLEVGAGMLTLADTNEEGANLLALQTRQQLSTTALSMAAQADQNVLRLFG